MAGLSATSHRRAVIDIGSNSIRLVVFAADRRVPTTLFNEKVSANLGRNLQEKGKIGSGAFENGIRGLARFALLIEAMDVDSVLCVATAAVRDASNGPHFIERVRALGLEPQVLSGTEEAAASAMGVLSAFPGAAGLVADLGGGSLELVEISGGTHGSGVTLPLGTLRLARMRESNRAGATRQSRALIQRHVARGLAQGRPLYLVGGSWRALTLFAMTQIDWPLRSPHGFVQAADAPAHLVNVLAHTLPRSLTKLRGISASRLATLGDAASVLSALVSHVRPGKLITSTFGLREGLMFDRLDAKTRAQDPLLSDLRDRLGSAAQGTMYGDGLDRWLEPVFPGEGAAIRRIRSAACWLALAARQPDRPERKSRVIELALRERLIGIDETGRAMLAAALLSFVGERTVPDSLTRLAPAADLAKAGRWGHLMRLAEKISGARAMLLERTAIKVEGERLVLDLGDARALYGEAAEVQHRATATALGLVAGLAS